MEKSPEIAVAQLRRSVQLLGSSTEGHGDPTLMRFLIARSMDPDKAAKMFVQWLKWRAEFVPLGFIPDSEIPDELEARKAYLQGLSREGHPVAIIKASNHFPSKDQLQFKRFVVQLLDKTIARMSEFTIPLSFGLCDMALDLSSFKGSEMGNEKLIAVIDLKQIAYKNIDARGLITGFQFLQTYYPERLAKCFLLNMPWFFVSVWRMVSYFLEKATLEKVVIVSNENEKEFIGEIGEAALPEEYGGQAKLVAIQDVVLTQMES